MFDLWVKCVIKLQKRAKQLAYTCTRTHTHTDRHANSVRLRDKREDECVTLEVKSRRSEKIGGRRLENQSKSCKIKPSEYSLKIMQSQGDEGRGGGGCDKRMREKPQLERPDAQKYATEKRFTQQ